jgi:transcriptional regulator with XRE-family HTH domain
VKEQADTVEFKRFCREHGRCLGLAVKEFRTNRGLTRSEVAKRANVSVLWIQRLGTDHLHTNYTIRRLDQVARALGVELYDLYKRADDRMGPPPWLESEGR